ncbi:alpha-glucosidase C-terminal domain-containing protein, partial [Staphylococcus aureus]
NYKTINVAQQLEDEHSVLQFYKDLIQLRKSNDVYVYGQFDLVDAENSQVFAYTRTLNEKQVLIVGNLTNHEAELTVPFDLSHGEV